MKKVICFILALSCFVLCGCSSYDDGYNNGYAKGYKDGLAESFSDGYVEGHVDGASEMCEEIISKIEDIYRDINNQYDMYPEEAMVDIHNYFWDRSPSAMDDAVNALQEFFNELEQIRAYYNYY